MGVVLPGGEVCDPGCVVDVVVVVVDGLLGLVAGLVLLTTCVSVLLFVFGGSPPWIAFCAFCCCPELILENPELCDF